MDNYDLVSTFLCELGWKILNKPSISDNYFDLTAVSDKKSLRVEIKTLCQKQSGTWEAPAISNNQKRADAVAVVLPNGTVFIESMEDYLQDCSECGYRQFTWLRP